MEYCFVSPLADCSNRAGAGILPANCAADGKACKSQAPCIMPDSKSKVLQVGRDFMHRVMMACGLMSFFTLVAAAVSCCTCVHLHTGKAITVHARCRFEPMPAIEQWQEEERPEFSSPRNLGSSAETYTRYPMQARQP